MQHVFGQLLLLFIPGSLGPQNLGWQLPVWPHQLVWWWWIQKTGQPGPVSPDWHQHQKQAAWCPPPKSWLSSGCILCTHNGHKVTSCHWEASPKANTVVVLLFLVQLVSVTVINWIGIYLSCMYVKVHTYTHTHTHTHISGFMPEIYKPGLSILEFLSMYFIYSSSKSPPYRGGGVWVPEWSWSYVVWGLMPLVGSPKANRS